MSLVDYPTKVLLMITVLLTSDLFIFTAPEPKPKKNRELKTEILPVNVATPTTGTTPAVGPSALSTPAVGTPTAEAAPVETPTD